MIGVSLSLSLIYYSWDVKGKAGGAHLFYLNFGMDSRPRCPSDLRTGDRISPHTHACATTNPPIFIPALLTAWDELVETTNHNYFAIAPQCPEGRSEASANHILTALCIIHKPYYKLSHPRRPAHISQPKWNMSFINMLLMRSWSLQSCPIPLLAAQLND